MKKFTFILFFAAFAAAAFAQTASWIYNSENITIFPSSANLCIGAGAFPTTKLRVYQDVSGTVPSYGIYSSITGTGTDKYSGCFTGGIFVVMNGNVGIGTNTPAYPLDVTGTMKSTAAIFDYSLCIGTTTPHANLDIASNSADCIRIGEIGYKGNLNVPLNAVSAQFNIDFTGYRDINTEQIGARIAAIRLNNHQPNNALVQKTGLAFYTNPTGMNAGTTDLIERMRIAPDGNVGIGTEYPQTKLDVVNSNGTLGLSVAAFNIDPASNYNFTFLKNTGRLLLAWNRSAGRGEQNFISNRGAGDRGGFAFYDYDNSGKMTHLMTLNGINAANPKVLLDVTGYIRAEEVKVCLNQGCDFVFDKDYKLMPLQDLSTFISENKHLPEIAPASQMENEGINLSEMNAKLLQKVEELTLYIIDLQKQIDELKK